MIGGRNLNYILFFLLLLQIYQHDGRPQQICRDCCTKVVSCASVIRDLHDVQITCFAADDRA